MPGVVGLRWIGGVLQVGDGDDAVDRSRVAGGFLRGLDVRHRRRNGVQINRRMPARLERRDERLDGGRGCFEDEERVRAGVLELQDLRVEVRRADVVGLLVDDHLGRFVAQSLGQAVEVVLAVIVILIDDADLGIRRVFAGCTARRSAIRPGTPAASRRCTGTSRTRRQTSSRRWRRMTCGTFLPFK